MFVKTQADARGLVVRGIEQTSPSGGVSVFGGPQLPGDEQSPFARPGTLGQIERQLAQTLDRGRDPEVPADDPQAQVSRSASVE